MKKSFSRSLHPYHLRSTTAECNFKHHCVGVIREVIGYLELQAKRRPDRFVFNKVSTIAEHCKRYEATSKHEKGSRYSEREVKHALAFLVRRHIISKRLSRRIHGTTYEGWIVAPHDSLFSREHLDCFYVGRGKSTSGFFRRYPTFPPTFGDPRGSGWYWVKQSAHEEWLEELRKGKA